MKKILSLVLVIAMMASLVVLAPASAADGATVEVTDAVAKAGDTVTVDVIVTGTTLYAYALLVDFDESRLENPVIETVNGDEFTKASTIGGFTYSDASLTANVTAGAVDITEGYYLVTITFDVKADAPAGDAFVRIIDNDPSGKGDIFLAPTNDYKQNLLTWNSIAGFVTVVPDGFGAVGAVDSDFTYTDNGDGTCTLTAYNGTASALSIPSEIDGLTVTGLGAHLFVTKSVKTNTTITSVVIPATVTDIAAYSFINLMACTSIYVLGDPTIGASALGWQATIGGKGNTWSYTDLYVAFVDDEELGYPLITTVYFAEGAANVESYVAEADQDECTPMYEYILDTSVTTVVGETTIVYPVTKSSVTAPVVKNVIAWQVGDACIAPGAAIAVDEDITLTAVTVETPTTFNGASVKANANNAGLRFTADLDKATYDELVKLFGDAAVSHGMLIAPQAYVEAVNGAFTHAALDAYAGAGKGYLDFAINGCYTADEDSYTLAATVTNFSASTIAKNPAFVAVAYIAIEIGDDVAYVYGEYNWQTARDAKTVLANVLADADNGFGETELGWIATWKGYFDKGSK